MIQISVLQAIKHKTNLKPEILRFVNNPDLC